MSCHFFHARKAAKSTAAAVAAPVTAPCTIGLISQSMCLLVLPRPRLRRLPCDGRRRQIDLVAQHALLLLTEAPREVFARQSDPPAQVVVAIAHACLHVSGWGLPGRHAARYCRQPSSG